MAKYLIVPGIKEFVMNKKIKQIYFIVMDYFNYVIELIKKKGLDK